MEALQLPCPAPPVDGAVGPGARALRAATLRRMDRLLNERLVGLTGDAIRRAVARMLDDAPFWDLFRDVRDTTTATELTAFARRPLASLTSPRPDLALALRTRAAAVRVYVALGEHLDLDGTEEPLSLIERRTHPDIKRALLAHQMSEIALLALRLENVDVATLGHLLLEGSQAYLGVLVGLAQEYAVPIQPVDAALLPAGPIDMGRVRREWAEYEEGHAALLAEARASGLACYPLADGVD